MIFFSENACRSGRLVISKDPGSGRALKCMFDDALPTNKESEKKE